MHFHVEPQFWRRLINHIERARQVWDCWLGSSQVALVLKTGQLPAPGIGELFEKSLARSLEHPRILAFGAETGPESRHKPQSGWWRVLSPEGFVFVLSWKDAQPTLVDCFPGAGVDQADPEAGMRLSQRMILRYAGFDPKKKAFTLTQKGQGETGGPIFLDPEEWGFSATDSGYRYRPALARPSSSPAAPSALGFVTLQSSAAPYAQSVSSSQAAIAPPTPDFFSLQHIMPADRLSLPAARTAGLALQEHLKRLAADLDSLPARLTAQTLPCREETCLDLIESRTRAWAAYRAIDRVNPAWLGEAPDAELSEMIDAIHLALRTVDAALERTRPHWEPCLSATELPANFQHLLHLSANEPAPWWLAALQEKPGEFDEI